MKKILVPVLALALVVISAGGAQYAHAAAYDVNFNLKDSSDTPYTYPLNISGNPSNEIFAYDQSTNKPVAFTLSGGLVFDGTALSISGAPESSVANLNGDMNDIRTSITALAASTTVLGNSLAATQVTDEAAETDREARLETVEFQLATTSNARLVTTTSNGFMRAADKSKLDSLSSVQTWYNGSLATSSKHVTFTGTVSSGTVVFYLTNDGTSSGTALCSAAPVVLATVDDPSDTFGVGKAITNSNKTLTITVNARTFTTGLAGLLSVVTGTSLAPAANGTPVAVSVDCQ